MIHFLPQPKWNKEQKRWILRIQVNGRRKAFTSSVPKTEGKNIVKKAAEKWLESIDTNSNVTFEVAFRRWLDDYHARYGETQQARQNEVIGTLHLIPALGSIKMCDLRIEDYQSAISDAKPAAKKRKDGTSYTLTDQLSKKYLKKIKGTIVCFHKWAISHKYTDLIIDDALYVPVNAPVGEKEILQLDEVEKLFKNPQGLHYERALQFEVLTGLRPGEVIGLRIEDFDTVTGILHIRRSITDANKITDGKNKNARRDIYLPAIVRQIVEEQIEESRRLNSDWLFCHPSGMHGTQKGLNKDWKRLTALLGINPNTSPYSLRHTFYTHTEAAGVISERMVKMIFGHSEKTDSHALYGNHAIDGELKEIADKLAITPIYQAANN